MTDRLQMKDRQLSMAVVSTEAQAQQMAEVQRMNRVLQLETDRLKTLVCGHVCPIKI